MTLRDHLRQLHRDRRGTSMTEFVLTLPIFVFIFVGLVELGQLSRAAVDASERAKLKTFRKFLDVQSGGADDFQDLVGQASYGPGGAAHMHPTTGGGDAASQLEANRPRRPTKSQESVLAAYEANTYGRLATRGHLGEVSARLQPTVYSGKYGPSSVVDVLQTPEKSMFGSDPSGQVAAFDLVSDRLTTPPAGGQCQGLLELLTDRVNQALSSSGSRPMLAAGIRYGTVTGEIDTTSRIAGRNVDISTHWNTLVAPHVFAGDKNHQTAMATYIARLVMKTCSRAPYSRLLGISRGGDEDTQILGIQTPSSADRRLPEAGQGFHLPVPDPYPGGDYDQVGFNPPLMYRGQGLQVNYAP